MRRECTHDYAQSQCKDARRCEFCVFRGGRCFWHEWHEGATFASPARVEIWELKLNTRVTIRAKSLPASLSFRVWKRTGEYLWEILQKIGFSFHVNAPLNLHWSGGRIFSKWMIGSIHYKLLLLFNTWLTLNSSLCRMTESFPLHFGFSRVTSTTLSCTMGATATRRSWVWWSTTCSWPISSRLQSTWCCVELHSF